MYFSNWNRVPTTIDKINFQNCKFLVCFYSLSNELSNKSFVIFFYILGYWYCVEIKLVYLFYLSLCYFVLDRNVRNLHNFKIIELVLISLTEFIIDISGEFKVMHFTSSNLLHDFPNDKYMFS